MKINVTIFLGISLLLTTVSCKDYLDTPPVDRLTVNGFYETPAQASQGVIGVYANLRSLGYLQYLFLSECRSDNAWVIPRDNAIREYSEIGTFRATEELDTFNDVWNIWYKVIYNANVLLEQIPDIDFGDNTQLKDQLLGEAHFLRGWAYFELTRLYGNIPIIDRPMTIEEVQAIGQSSAKDVYDDIIVPDLVAAKSLLPEAKNMRDVGGSSLEKVGRADRMAAQGLLARVYMTMSGFPVQDLSKRDLAETEMEALISYSEANGNKYWAPDSAEWRKQWIPSTDYYNKYSLFAIQYRGNGSGNQAPFYFGPILPPSFTNHRLFGNTIHVEKSLMYEFEKVYNTNGQPTRDARGIGHSVLTGYDAETGYPKYSETRENLTLPDGSQVDVQVTGMYYKFMPSFRKLSSLGMGEDIEGQMRGGNDWPVNLPIIRFEDILLMYAEILSEKGDITGALDIVNRIRTRVGAEQVTATTSGQALSLVKNERRIEFMGEGVRWFDLVRWNEWQAAIHSKFDRYNNPDGTDKGNVREGRHLYPIPRDQMNVRPGLYTQNLGY